jgi:hypothetical protein
VGNVRRLNSLPGRLPGAFFFDRRPAAVPAAWLFVVIEIAELLPGAVLHDTGGADVLDRPRRREAATVPNELVLAGCTPGAASN